MIPVRKERAAVKARSIGHRISERTGSALVITMLLLVILTVIGIYIIDISTTEMDIALHYKVGTITRNTAESGAYVGIEELPTTYPAGSDCTVTLTAGTNMTSTYTFQSDLSGPMQMEPGYGTNFMFASYSVVSNGSAPSGFTGGVRVDAAVTFGPMPSGTGY
jgi:Tfp pilus assembly protein PilX